MKQMPGKSALGSVEKAEEEKRGKGGGAKEGGLRSRDALAEQRKVSLSVHREKLYTMGRILRFFESTKRLFVHLCSP